MERILDFKLFLKPRLPSCVGSVEEGGIDLDRQCSSVAVVSGQMQTGMDL